MAGAGYPPAPRRSLRSLGLLVHRLRRPAEELHRLPDHHLPLSLAAVRGRPAIGVQMPLDQDQAALPCVLGDQLGQPPVGHESGTKCGRLRGELLAN
jgi:hypothetical protein